MKRVKLGIKKGSTVQVITGGDKGKKFMVKRFHDILLSVHEYSSKEQQKELESQFNNWRGNFEQVDDVLVIGIKM